MKQITFGEISLRLKEIGCTDIHYTDNGLEFTVGSLVVELRWEALPNGLVLQTKGCQSSTSFGGDLAGCLERIKTVLENERK